MTFDLPEAVGLASVLLLMYGVHVFGLSVILRGTEHLPRTLRRAIPAPSRGPTRHVSIVWVLGMMLISQALVVGMMLGAQGVAELPAIGVLAAELAIAAFWTVFVFQAGKRAE